MIHLSQAINSAIMVRMSPKDQPSVNISPETALPELEKTHEIAMTQKRLSQLAEEVDVPVQDEEKSKTTTLDSIAEDLHTELSIEKEVVLNALNTELQAIGIQDDTLSERDGSAERIMERVRKILRENKKSEKADKHTSIAARFSQLKEAGVPLRDTLKALRTEFKGQLDEETEAVLGRFESLFSEEVLPDKEERKAVETLFLSQGVTTFTAASFSGFVTTLYEQPNDVISEETKIRIEEKFNIPRQRIITGGQFAKAAFAKDEEGNYQHNSPENALRLENGMSSYVQPNGEAVVSFQSPHSEPKIIYVRSLETWFSEDAAKNINYGIIRDAVFDNLDQMTGLFGGSQEEHEWMKPERQESVEKANRFTRLLIGNREPNYILQYEDMPNIKSVLSTIADPRNQSEEENYADLRELGILNGEQLNWSRIKTIGLILRKNRYFRTQAIKNPVAPYILLKQELQTIDHNETEKETTSAFTESGGGS